MRHLDLFSGIGGFALAARWVWGDQYEIVGFCEIDKFCQKVLKKHWPDKPCYKDIKELDGKAFKAIDLITGGFPCQPYSVAGKRKGAEDDRALWPEMFRIIKEARPGWIIAENVAGIVNMELDQVLSDLESEGYSCTPFILPACAVDAPHRRDRVWIVAHSVRIRRGGWCDENGAERQVQIAGSCTSNESGVVADFTKQGLQNGRQTGEQESPNEKKGRVAFPEFERCGGARWAVEPGVGRMVNGLSGRVDRLKGLGNAIVPQVAARIMQAIKQGRE